MPGPRYQIFFYVPEPLAPCRINLHRATLESVSLASVTSSLGNNSTLKLVRVTMPSIMSHVKKTSLLEIDRPGEEGRCTPKLRSKRVTYHVWASQRVRVANTSAALQELPPHVSPLQAASSEIACSVACQDRTILPTWISRSCGLLALRFLQPRMVGPLIQWYWTGRIRTTVGAFCGVKRCIMVLVGARL
jgi:hypothetical protein